MNNKKKIPWGKLTMQIFYLAAGLFFHVFAVPKFKQVFDGMGVKMPIDYRLIFETPLVIVVVGLAFLLFLWAWKYDRLENKTIVALINLPLVLPLYLFIVGELRYVSINQMGAIPSLLG